MNIYEKAITKSPPDFETIYLISTLNGHHQKNAINFLIKADTRISKRPS